MQSTCNVRNSRHPGHSSIYGDIRRCSSCGRYGLGKPVSPDLNEFPENSRTAFAPPPAPFSENFIAIFFRKFITKITVSNAKKIAMKFFGSEMTPPLSEIFRKFIRIRGHRLPLPQPLNIFTRIYPSYP